MMQFGHSFFNWDMLCCDGAAKLSSHTIMVNPVVEVNGIQFNFNMYQSCSLKFRKRKTFLQDS